MPTAASHTTISPLIERALDRELARRRGLRPHAQLAIAPDARAVAIEAAFARLASEYAPAAFVGHGDGAVAAATEICALLAAARREMLAHAPSPPPTPPSPRPTLPGKRSSRPRAWWRALRRALSLRSVAGADRRDRPILDDV